MVSFRKRGDLHGQSKENPRRSACGGNRRKRNYSGIDAAEEKQPENSGGYSCERITAGILYTFQDLTRLLDGIKHVELNPKQKQILANIQLIAPQNKEYEN